MRLVRGRNGKIAVISDDENERREMSLKRLTPQELAFVRSYVKCWSPTQAAEEAKYGNPVAAGIRLLRTARIAEAIRESEKDIKTLFSRRSKDMMDVLYQLAMSDENPASVRAVAAKDLLDRAGYKPDMIVRVDDERNLDRDAMQNMIVDMLVSGAGGDMHKILQNVIDKTVAIDTSIEKSLPEGKKEDANV